MSRSNALYAAPYELSVVQARARKQLWWSRVASLSLSEKMPYSSTDRATHRRITGTRDVARSSAARASAGDRAEDGKRGEEDQRLKWKVSLFWFWLALAWVPADRSAICWLVHGG